VLVRVDQLASNLGVQGGDSGSQTRRDNFCVMLQSRLRVRMPQLALHVFNGGRFCMCVDEVRRNTWWVKSWIPAFSPNGFRYRLR
jgi:hypothetical protein